MINIQRDTRIKISNYINKISNIRKTSQKIQICLELYNYLVNDNECIKILQDNDNFYKTVKQKLCNELYGNIDEKEYNNFYNKLLQIKKSSIISYNYLDSGNKINTIDL